MNNYKYIQIPIFFLINDYLKILYNIFGLNIEKICCEKKFEEFLNIYKKIGLLNNDNNFLKSIKLFAINLKNYDYKISFKHLKKYLKSLFENILINISDDNFINIKNEKNENCFILNQNFIKILSKSISKKLKKIGINMNTKIWKPDSKKVINYYKLIKLILNNNLCVCSDNIINNEIKKRIGKKLYSLWIKNAYKNQVFDNYKMFYNNFILSMYKQYKENLFLIDPFQLKLFNLFFQITLNNKIQNLKNKNSFWDILLTDFEKLNENQLKKKYYGGKINIKICNKLIDDTNKKKYEKYNIGISLIFSSNIKKIFLEKIYQYDLRYYNSNFIIEFFKSMIKLLNKFDKLKNMIYENIWSIDHADNIYTRLDFSNEKIIINNIWNIYTEPFNNIGVDYYIKDNKNFDISTIFINKKKSEIFFNNIINYHDFEWSEMYKLINGNDFFMNYENLKKNIIKINPIIIVNFLKAFNFQECEFYNKDKIKEKKIETFSKWYNRHLIIFIKNNPTFLQKINKKSSIKLELFLNLFISFINYNKFVLNKQDKSNILDYKLTTKNIKLKKKLKSNFKNLKHNFLKGGTRDNAIFHRELITTMRKSLYLRQFVDFFNIFNKNMEKKNKNVDSILEKLFLTIFELFKIENELNILLDGMIKYQQIINIDNDNDIIVDEKKIKYYSDKNINEFKNIISTKYINI